MDRPLPGPTPALDLEHLAAGQRLAVAAHRGQGSLLRPGTLLFHMGEVMAGHHGCLTRLWQASPPPEQDERRTELWRLMEQMLDQAKASGEVRPRSPSPTSTCA